MEDPNRTMAVRREASRVRRQSSGKAQHIWRKTDATWKASYVKGFSVRNGRGGSSRTSKQDVRMSRIHQRLGRYRLMAMSV